VVLALILAAISASARSGQVWVGAPAGMTVVFDGEEAWEGGVMVPGVAPGMHTIVVRAPGGATVERWVQVHDLETIRVEISPLALMAHPPPRTPPLRVTVQSPVRDTLEKADIRGDWKRALVAAAGSGVAGVSIDKVTTVSMVVTFRCSSDAAAVRLVDSLYRRGEVYDISAEMIQRSQGDLVLRLNIVFARP
jgi:hypothetical protein